VKALAETHLMLERFTIKQRKWIDKGADEDVFQLRWAAQAVRFVPSTPGQKTT
jgi:hypothetical protein